MDFPAGGSSAVPVCDGAQPQQGWGQGFRIMGTTRNSGQIDVAVCRTEPANVLVADVDSVMGFVAGSIVSRGGASAAQIDVSESLAEPVTPRRGWYLPLKFAAEWSLAAVLLVCLSPLLLALALLVRLTSRGPSFYAQTRLGLNGRHYRILKLRTMVHEAEKATGPVWAGLSGDARITPLGRVLRDTHLDELPQLWNVVRGEMALIGPRPERPEIAARIERRVSGYGLRLAVRPGVTGLAQMLLPADDPAELSTPGSAMLGLRRKLAHDLLYVREAGPLLDLRIALCTPCHFAASAASAAGEALAKLARRCGDAARGLLERARRGMLGGYHIPDAPGEALAN